MTSVRGAYSRFLRSLPCLALFLAFAPAHAKSPSPKELPEDLEAREAEAAWKAAGYPGGESPEAERLMTAAVHAGRTDLAEALLAGGPVLKKMLPVPAGGRDVPLQIVRSFDGIHATLEDEMFASFNREEGWLARRITTNLVEIWTAEHGWLFDGTGQLIHEAEPPRRSGTGREWYGAFLPDGRWVTTDLDEMDGTLVFFSVAGKPERYLTWKQLAPGQPEYGSPLLGWGRSDKNGTGWVVNVGSEEGVATVWVGPTGAPRILHGTERWQLCFPRALGPRGTGWEMSVPSDNGRQTLSRSEAGHGPRVGYPDYSCTTPVARKEFAPDETEEASLDSCIVPNGNYVFGFWPGERSYFIGSDGNNTDYLHFLGDSDAKLTDYEPSGTRTRKLGENVDGEGTPTIDKTWFFDERGKMTAWIRGRRIADAADQRAMLFRLTADSRVVTLRSNYKVQEIRRFVWKDASTADAVALWDDLRMGLFIRKNRLILARW